MTSPRFAFRWMAVCISCFHCCSLTAFANNIADGVLKNGTVVTCDATDSVATAVAWQDGKILAVGSDDEMEQHIGPQTHIFDLDGRLATPGFIESHGHFSSIGFAKMNLELRDDTSWERIVAKVAQAARTTPAGQWIIGRGWHQEKWTRPLENHVEGYPLHDQLSEVSPRHPVLLTHASGHLAIANAEAMRLAGIENDTEDPRGGEILRAADGRPTGVLRETAQQLVSKLRDQAADSAATWDHAVALAAEECLAQGITTFHDAGSSFEEIDRFRHAARQGELPLRLWVMIRDDLQRTQAQLAKYRTLADGNGFLTVRAIKRSIDGALGSHGAWLLEPYEDLPTSTGLNTTSVEELAILAELAVEHDCQLCVHAIGDRANREVLDLFERTFAKFPSEHSRRWRIEHAQHLHPEDIPRFGKLGIIAAMQGVHCTSDAAFVGPRLGLRRAALGAYRWRDLLDSGAVICNGTDAPVESVNVLESFYASVTRRNKDGLIFFADQVMTRQEALRSYTLSGAFAAFEEMQKGSLEVGKLADIVVLSKNILTCPEEEILRTKVDLTIVDGKVRWGEG